MKIVVHHPYEIQIPIIVYFLNIFIITFLKRLYVYYSTSPRNIDLISLNKICSAVKTIICKLSHNYFSLKIKPWKARSDSVLVFLIQVFKTANRKTNNIVGQICRSYTTFNNIYLFHLERFEDALLILPQCSTYLTVTQA